ncbi:MAG: hypothetical protein ABIL46_00815 [candidate division WOR-3 bacterium]
MRRKEAISTSEYQVDGKQNIMVSGVYYLMNYWYPDNLFKFHAL